MTSMYELKHHQGGVTATIRGRGREVLASPTINRGTAFSHQQRQVLGITGLLPTEVTTLNTQLRRAYAQYSEQPTDLQRWSYLAALHDRNEVLYHRLLSEHLAEMLPIVYTPTVGAAIQQFSRGYTRPRGIHLSIDRPGDVETSLRNTGLGPDDVDLLISTDSESILGIGDQGVGGIEIAIGKQALYTVAAGFHPQRMLPVVLDTGTDNQRLLDDELYLGARHLRIRDDRYDQLLDAFVAAAMKVFPNAMLHWEDFGATNARRVLHRYTDRVCSFNDDLQGTAAVVAAAVLSATRAAGTRMVDQTIVIHGAGTAGLGVADVLRDLMVDEGLSRDEAVGRIYALGSRGLLVDDDMLLRDFQRPYARSRGEVADWADRQGQVHLEQVVHMTQPTILIGTSAQAEAFTERIVVDMARHTERPIILPLSNPTYKAEALPSNLITWTDGRVLTATGSPFTPVSWRRRTYQIAQANNALVFPGLGLGVKVAGARRISDRMIMAAAMAVADLAEAGTPGTQLLPAMDQLRQVSHAVAVAVAAAADAEGLARFQLTNPDQQIRDAMWEPAYPLLDIR